MESLRDKDLRFIWHPFTQTEEWEKGEVLFIDRGKGVYLYDVEGRKYIDGVSSLWVNLHGHRVKELDGALIRQLRKVAHTTFLGLSHEEGVKLAEELVSIVPEGLKRVFYSDNGSTAVEVALKVAYQFFRNQGFKKKRRFLSLRNGYHGDTLGAVGVGGIGLFHGVYRPIIRPSIKAPSPFCYRCELKLSYPSCSLACAEELRKLVFKFRDELCAVIIEVKVQAAGGIIVFPEGYLKAVEEACRENDVLLIADEVATGFGRTGKIFACEHEGITPDIMALGKGITGGYLPLAVTLFKEEIYDAFRGKHSERKTFYHGHTYTANPLACAVARENIRLLKRNWKMYAKKVKFIEDGVSLLKDLKYVGDVRGIGFMWGVEVVRNKEKKTPFPIDDRVGHRICMKVRERGVILRPLGDVVVIMPPLAISQEDFMKLVDALRWAIENTLR